MLRIGMLTSGGDCQALNAAMRGVVKGICSKRDDVEIYGFKDGYKGLIYADFSMLTPKDFSGILTRGGTILGTSRQPFKLMRVPDKDGLDKVEAMKHTYHKLNLNCLIILGGNGTHKTANLLREEGLNVITLPKTIDNDLWGTDMTFGFQSAVDIATDTIDRIHTTATSHSRVFIIEVMGHKVGYVTLHAGIAGGADIILLPEIPYDINVITDVINRRSREGKPFTILAVAEGAISKEDAKLKKKEYKEANRRFLKKLSFQEGVFALPCGIYYKVLETGEGTISPGARSIVTVHYKGSLIDGRVFDNSYERTCPDALRLSDVIEGWQVALQKMHVGDKWIIYIPYAMGYGIKSFDSIPAYSTLIFEVELLGVA